MKNQLFQGLLTLACMVGLCACSSEQESISDSVWKLNSMEGIPTEIIQASADAFILEFNAEDHYFLGQTNCNHFFGPYTEADGNILSFKGGMASTKMACPNMEYEDAFLHMLTSVDSYRIKKGKLTLYGAGQPLATFNRMEWHEAETEATVITPMVEEATVISEIE